MPASKVAALILAVVAVASATLVHAAQLIVNGGFESGLSGWTVVNQTGSAGTFFVQQGSTSPVNGLPVAVPPQGTRAAMTDAEGPGSHVLYQDFVVPTVGESAILSFRVYVANRADQFATPDTLDFAGLDFNQQARVDLMLAGSDPFSLGAGDVLATAFRTLVGDPLQSGYFLVTIDLTEVLMDHVGETLRLRFAEVDNLFFFNFGVDDVRLAVDEGDPGPTPIPEAPTLLLALIGLFALRRARGR